MNIDKLLGSLSDLWARHSPTVIMHIVLFVVLQGWVLDPAHKLAGETLWQSAKNAIDTLLAEAGIKIERGYALAAIGYVYLIVLQWLASAVTSLPGLRTWVADPPLDASFARYAGQVLRTPPDMFATLKRVNEVVENYVRRFRERGEPEPYHWLQIDISRWSRFYGLSVLAVAGTLWWLLEEGASGAVSRNRVGHDLRWK